MDREHDDEQLADPEGRHRVADQHEARPGLVDAAMRRDRRLNADRDADQDAERIARAGEQQGAGKPFGQDIEHRTAVIHRVAEIAVQHVQQIAVQTLKERLVELEALLQRGAQRRRHRHVADHGLDRIARNELQQAEDQDDDADQKQQPPAPDVPRCAAASTPPASTTRRQPHGAMHHRVVRPSIPMHYARARLIMQLASQLHDGWTLNEGYAELATTSETS